MLERVNEQLENILKKPITQRVVRPIIAACMVLTTAGEVKAQTTSNNLAVAVNVAPNTPTNCQYILGFKTLHDIDPDSIGDCVENESHNPINGDALQHTTKGLMVWRKLSNDMAFTTGPQTLVVNGRGARWRSSYSRFSDEPDFWAYAIKKDPAFGQERESIITQAIAQISQTTPDKISSDYIDQDFKDSFESQYPGSLGFILNSLTSKSLKDHFGVIDSINLGPTDTCPLKINDKDVFACWTIRSNKKGLITLNPSSLERPSIYLSSTIFKELIGNVAGLALYFDSNLNDLTALNAEVEYFSYDAELQYDLANLKGQPDYTSYIRSDAQHTLNQGKLLASLG